MIISLELFEKICKKLKIKSKIKKTVFEIVMYFFQKREKDSRLCVIFLAKYNI